MNYDEKAFADKEPRNIVDVLAKTDASVMNFGGESATLQGVYVRGLQLGARQFSVNGLAGLYSAYVWINISTHLMMITTGNLPFPQVNCNGLPLCEFYSVSQS